MAIETESKFGATTVVSGRRRRLDTRVSLTSVVSGVTSDVDACAQAIAALPTSFAVDGVAVPRTSVATTRFRADAAMVYSLYSFLGGGAISPENPFAVANIRVFTDEIPWWSDQTEEDRVSPAHGFYPSGPVNQEYDPDVKAIRYTPWQRRVTIWEITIDVEVEEPIIDVLSAYHDTVNESAFGISNKLFPTGTLWFNGPNQRSVLTVGTDAVHAIRYRFLYRGDGWLRQALIGDPGTTDPELRDMFRMMDWDPADFTTT